MSEMPVCMLGLGSRVLGLGSRVYAIAAQTRNLEDGASRVERVERENRHHRSCAILHARVAPATARRASQACPARSTRGAQGARKCRAARDLSRPPQPRQGRPTPAAGCSLWRPCTPRGPAACRMLPSGAAGHALGAPCRIAPCSGKGAARGRACLARAQAGRKPDARASAPGTGVRRPDAGVPLTATSAAWMPSNQLLHCSWSKLVLVTLTRPTRARDSS